MGRKIQKKYIKKNIDEHKKYMDIILKESFNNKIEAADFQIDTKPKNKTREPLKNDRFKKKEKIIDKKSLKNINSQIEKFKNKENVLNNLKQVENDKAYDIWSNNNIKPKPEIKKYELWETNKLITPLNGQSYNPDAKSHSNLLSKIVENHNLNNLSSEAIRENVKKSIEEKNKMKENKKLEAELILKDKINNLKLKIKQNKNENDTQNLNKQLDKLNKKLNNIVNSNIKEYFLDFDKKQEYLKSKKIKKEKFLKEKKEKVKKGDLIIKNKKMEYYIPDAKLIEDLPKTLKDVESSNKLIKETFDKIYNRGLIDKTKPKNRGKNKSFGYKTFNRERHDNDLIEKDDNAKFID